MATMISEVYDAFREAKVSEEAARKAAEAVAAYEHRFTGMESRLASMDGRMSGIEARITMLTWVVGINAAATLAVLAKLLTLR